MLENYLRDRQELIEWYSLLTCAIRPLPTTDRCCLLQSYGIPALVVGTKADKLSRGAACSRRSR